MQNTKEIPFKFIAYKQGVKIVDSTDNDIKFEDNIFLSDFNSYLLDPEYKTITMNPDGALTTGFGSVQDSIGRAIDEVSDKHTGVLLMHNSKKAFMHEACVKTEEEQTKLDGETNNYLTFKMPCYNYDNKKIGVFGFSIILGVNSLLRSLERIEYLIPGIDLNLTKKKYQNPLLKFGLTNRQQQCLLLSIKGLTAKQVAQLLGISYRTVEEYLDIIKHKTLSSTKSEMISKVIEILLPDLKI